MCVRGKALLYELCASHGVGHRNCGKLVVANGDAEAAALRALQDRAIANGVPVQWLEAHEAHALEPALRCTAALFSPSTGIVDSHGLMLALQGDLEHAGGMIALGSAVESTVVAAGGPPARRALRRMAAKWRRLSSSTRHRCTRAGSRADSMASTSGSCRREYFSKGNYYALSGRPPFSHLIYPAPADAWLGVHLTLDLGGQAKFGPDQEWLDVARPEDIDYAVDPRRAEGFYAEVRRYWPGLADGALQPSYSGVRPKIHAPAEKAPDFRIDGSQLHGVPGLVNLFGIESPGLTSALAIGEHVLKLLEP